MSDFDKGRLERLKRSLYSRDSSAVPTEKRTPISETDVTEVKNSWGTPSSFDLPKESMTRKNNSFFNKFLITSVIFFAVALGAAAFIILGGFNSISSNNVDIKITGPNTISSGEELDLDLSVVNGNRTDLQKVNLFVQYPDGTQVSDKSGKSLSRDEAVLDTIAVGGSKDYTAKALLFGQKDEVKTITLRVEYNVAGSNAVFSKEKTYAVSISSSPLLLNVISPAQINSGQEVTLSMDVTSNSSVPVQNVLAKVSYPYGFTYESSSIAPISASGNTVWNLGDLKNGDKKTLTITGTLVGQDMEDRSFNISVGSGGDASAKDFTIALASSQATVGIRKSFFGLSVATSNNPNNVGNIGQSVPVTINWQNTLPDQVVNGSVTAKLSGNVFDVSKVVASNGGFFRSLDNTILWSNTTTGSLAQMAPDESGNLSFSLISLANPSQVRSIKNPHIDVLVKMTGTRVGADTTTVTSDQSLTIKFNSDMEMTAKSYRSSGPSSNTGPVPPRVNQESTYTITWTLTNTENDLSGTVVSATLPIGVEWKSAVSPGSEKVAYDPSQRTILWTVGNVATGAGFSNSPRTVSFQVGLTPSITQSGSQANLVENILAVGTDTYTQSNLRASSDNVTTRFSDPSFSTGQEIIAK